MDVKKSLGAALGLGGLEAVVDSLSDSEYLILAGAQFGEALWFAAKP